MAVATVTVGGWLVATFLLLIVLRLTFFGAAEPIRTYAMVMFLIGMTLIPVAPAAGAWLSAHYGWTVAAWTLGIVAGVAAIVAAVWVFLFATTT